MEVTIDNRLAMLESRQDEIESKLDKILSLLENDVVPSTNKMSEHINFVDQCFSFVSTMIFRGPLRINQSNKIYEIDDSKSSSK